MKVSEVKMELGKIIICAILLIAVVVGLAIAFYHLTQPTFNPEDYKIESIYVNAGDTLSGYYYEYAKAGTDMVEYIEAVKALNNMRTSTIYADTYIKVYVAK